MRRLELAALWGLFVVGVPVTPAAAQQVVGYSVSASSREAALTFHLATGDPLQFALDGGAVRIGGQEVGRYEVGGVLETSWRALLSRSAELSADQMVAAVRAWSPDGLEAADAAALDALRAGLGDLEPMAAVPAPPAPPAAIAEELAAAEAALAEAAGEMDAAREAARVIRNELRTSLREGLRETARAAAAAGRDVQVEIHHAPRVDFGPAPIESIWGGLLALLGGFLGLGGIGFAASFFGERQLDVAADTVSTSFTRSFFVGLFAQPLILPVFGATIVGLALTVVGILLIPVALIAFPVALAAAVVLGYLAVARVAGAGWLQRRGQEYGREGLPMLKSLATGLAILLAIWLPAVLLGWVPVAGTILLWTAALVTWVFATTGLGAMILTRGGLRGTFGRRFAPPPVTPDELFGSSETAVSTSEWLAGEAVR